MLKIRNTLNTTVAKVFVSEKFRKMSSKNSSSHYCLQSVKNYDYENFLHTLLLKGEIRRFAFAIRAFNVELAKIPISVSDDHICKMKLKFWYDALDKCFEKNIDSIPKHPVILELQNVVCQNKLSKIYFKRLIMARERPINMPFKTMKELEEYSEFSVSSLYYILLEIINIKNINADHAASHLGKAQGIINLLRAIPKQGRIGSGNIPQEALMKHGVNQERIIRDIKDDKGVEDCIFDIASVAHQHITKFKQLSNKMPKEANSIFLASIIVERYLNRLRKVKFRLSHQSLQQRDQLLSLALLWNNIIMKY